MKRWLSVCSTRQGSNPQPMGGWDICAWPIGSLRVCSLPMRSLCVAGATCRLLKCCYSCDSKLFIAQPDHSLISSCHVEFNSLSLLQNDLLKSDFYQFPGQKMVEPASYGLDIVSLCWVKQSMSKLDVVQLCETLMIMLSH